MPGGLTLGEELDLATAENRRYRAALEIALKGLATARKRGFPEASDIIGDVNAALASRPAAASPPVRPALLAWGGVIGTTLRRNIRPVCLAAGAALAPGALALRLRSRFHVRGRARELARKLTEG
jgi:hypothetical protein